MKIHGVSASWSSLTYQEAVANLIKGTTEPILGMIDTSHIQLCPQHSNYLSEELLVQIMEQYPTTKFRLHSDVRLKNKRGVTIDCIDYNEDTLWYFKTLSYFSNILKSPLYSLHAGARKDYTIHSLFDKCHAMQDLFQCPVALEGHYPFKNQYWLIDCWKEYDLLLKSGLPYALDLSHLNIVAKKEGWNWDLTKEMLASKQCAEVHISFNEGHLDNHNIAYELYLPLWEQWKTLLQNVNPEATIFSEGNQILAIRKMQNELLIKH
jgi:hypothetical protein